MIRAMTDIGDIMFAKKNGPYLVARGNKYMMVHSRNLRVGDCVLMKHMMAGDETSIVDVPLAIFEVKVDGVQYDFFGVELFCFLFKSKKSK